MVLSQNQSKSLLGCLQTLSGWEHQGNGGTGLCNHPEQMYLSQPSVPLHKYQQHIAAFDTAQPEASTSLFVASTQQSLPQARACMDGDQINTHAFTACLAADKGRPSMAKAFRGRESHLADP